MAERYTLDTLQKKIGYRFSKPKFLRIALTRRQYYQGKKSRDNTNTMEPLATLGDAVLDCIVIHRLYETGERDEGILSQDKEENVRKEKSFAIAMQIHLEKFVRWGKNEEKDKIWNSGPKTFDTCIEALIGAVFLDAQESGKNGMKKVEKMLEKIGFFEKNNPLI